MAGSLRTLTMDRSKSPSCHAAGSTCYGVPAEQRKQQLIEVSGSWTESSAADKVDIVFQHTTVKEDRDEAKQSAKLRVHYILQVVKRCCYDEALQLAPFTLWSCIEVQVHQSRKRRRRAKKKRSERNADGSTLGHQAADGEERPLQYHARGSVRCIGTGIKPIIKACNVLSFKIGKALVIAQQPYVYISPELQNKLW